MKNLWNSRKKGFAKRNIIGFLIFTAIFIFFMGTKGKLLAISETLPIYKVNKNVDKEAGAFKFFDKKEENTDGESDFIGIDDITYQPETKTAPFTPDTWVGEMSPEVFKQMEDIEYLKKNFYIVDGRTALLSSDIRAKQFIEKDFSINTDGDKPKVLIFHTHSTESFIDSNMESGMEEGIWGVGEELKNILEKKYGIKVMHDTGRYDMLDGKGKIIGAYERMEPSIEKILKENPSIEVVIDMHRDGLPENIHLVTDINGKPTAKIMFFNGMCRLEKNGVPTEIEGLSNPNLSDNLAFSLQMKIAANQKYPDFTRKNYLNAYRYSLHMKPRSLLIEVGSQMNTKQEVKNAMIPLAELLAEVLTK